MLKRLWWEQTSVYWELPFYAEMGFLPPLADPNDDDMAPHDHEVAGREQLWAFKMGYSSPTEENP